MLKKLIEREDLSYEEAYELFNRFKVEKEVKIAAYLAALQTKGFTSEELAGFARAMRDSSIKLRIDGEKMDTCGTGGDGIGTINVSTASAIILSCFSQVAKHGNRSVTSKSGSADVIGELGINFSEKPEEAREMIKRTNFTFLFAPAFHPALKRIMPARRELGVETIFNVLGPLANPSEPEYQLIGVYSPELCGIVARATSMLGVKRALIVHGGGLDEVAVHDSTLVYEVNKDKIESYKVSPEDAGIKRCNLKDLLVGDGKTSSKAILNVFSGNNGPIRDFIVLNSSYALYTAKKADDILDAKEMVEDAIDEGSVLKKLEEIRSYSSRFVE